MAMNKMQKIMLIAAIVHGCAAFIGLLHWILVWNTSPYKDFGGALTSTFYSWMLLLAVLVFIAAVVYNLAVERKRQQGKITSLIAIVGAVLAFYYIIAWWAGDTGKGIRGLEDIGPVKLSGGFKFGRILYWLFAPLAIASGIIPALFGGLVRAN